MDELETKIHMFAVYQCECRIRVVNTVIVIGWCERCLRSSVRQWGFKVSDPHCVSCTESFPPNQEFRSATRVKAAQESTEWSIYHE